MMATFPAGIVPPSPLRIATPALLPDFDQFTRWRCDQCGDAGFDSWNKQLHDGIDYGGDYPDPCVRGDMCQCCGKNAAIAYTRPDRAPTVIYGADDWSDEVTNMDKLVQSPSLGRALRPSTKRDHDWSGGSCTNLRAAPPLGTAPQPVDLPQRAPTLPPLTNAMLNRLKARSDCWAFTQHIVDSAPVVSVYAACEWDELDDDGKAWLHAIVLEVTRQTGGTIPAPPFAHAIDGDADIPF